MDRRRRVAVTVEQCWHRVPGGTATATLGTLAALADRSDLELVGVAARHAGPAPAAFRPPIEVRHLPLPRLALYESWHGLRWPKVERATGPVDVVHATAIAVPPCEAPLVMTINDLAFLADASQATRHGNRFFRRGTELARRHARLVLVPSEATAAECRDAGFDPDVIRLVPYGVVAREVGETDVAALRSRRGLSRPYVLFVGTVEPRKNLAAVAGAMAGLAGRGVDLVLVGPDGWNEDLKARLAPLSGTDVAVHRLGFVPADELPALYAGAAAFCYPSLREGFGLPVLEAMAHGAPVVTSSTTSTAEVAGDGALLVEPTDHGAVRDALVRLLDDAELAEDLRDRGRKRAATYTWERTAELTAAAYAEAAP
ncbi:glycosyltransferase family 4 protein [Aquihabitans sp. G128]|uniref:glycosyltransferase family 4 protein n=1 Tax=Aquihabitans sp. G128 TaxID=2849779 RepID=UPI001C23F07D|nr:glycosyltransferase family 1 protein [Aquihabitans sp. G128]QXC61432.1 glycosyltransferase family 4 protein [Aquihabitans sp. G128]